MHFCYQLHPDGHPTWHEASAAPRMAGAQKAKDPHPKAPLWEQQLQAARDITQKHLAGIMDGAAFDAQIVRVKHQFEASRDAMYPGWRERYDREFVAWVERRSH